MINIGINGLGRIGKCIFLQLLNQKNICIKAVNILNYDINQLEKYIKYDNVHKYNNQFEFEIINESLISINGNKIQLFNERDAKNINWKEYNINYVIDATGYYLTKEKANSHDVDYVIMSAPPKDNTPMYVVGVNDNNYNGENIISNASCTTNCITPLLKILNEEFEIVKGNFTTVHATTSSQSLSDGQPNKNRTYRSIFNNIIPHTTGASKAIDKVLPEIEGLIKGTSLRIPTSDVSIVDCNIQLNEITNLNEILKRLKKYSNIEVNDLKLVSSDFITTICPTIIDSDCCMDLGNNEYKFMIWYDNEWSYSAQLVKMLKVMIEKNNNNQYKLNPKYQINNGNFENKEVLLRVDYNVPIGENQQIIDSYRIDITIPTLQKILRDNPKRLIITTHLGRPIENEEKYSTKFLINYLEEILEEKVYFLKNGFTEESLNELENNNYRIYLMENVRYHSEEIKPTTEFKNLINKFCNIYVNDAFGVCHREHSSVIGFNCIKYYGYTIQKETELLNSILYSKKRKCAIIGGGKMDSKLELLKNLCKTMDTIYICGGNINSILKQDFNQYLKEISNKKANIILMEDGYKSSSLEDEIINYSNIHNLKENEYFYDCGDKSINTLEKIIQSHDLIIWNGVCGVIEQQRFSIGSIKLLQLLIDYNKKTIIAGGDSVGFVNTNLKKIKNKNIELCSGGGASIDYLTSGILIGLKQFL